MHLIDTHAHLTDARYVEDMSEVLNRSRQAGIDQIILASTNEEDCLASIKLSREITTADLAVWCSVGIHPHDAKTYTDQTDSKLRDWISDRKANRIVALGEIGLDYFYDLSERDVQKEVFRKQLDIAYAYTIPIVLHERDATKDVLDILREYKSKDMLCQKPGVCHCFSGSVETAQILLSYGFYLGFDGPITFKNSRHAPLVIERTPMNRLLTETDCPYLTPVPFRGQRNEPAYISYIVEKMAEIKAVSVNEMADQVMNNASELFGI